MLLRLALVDLVLKMGVIALLNWFGWLTLLSNGQTAEGSKEILSSSLLTAVIFAAIVIFFLWAVGGFGGVFLTAFLCSFSIFLLPELAEGYIRLNDSDIVTLVSGFLIFTTTLFAIHVLQMRPGFRKRKRACAKTPTSK